MLTVPALILFGLPPTVANGTNRIALLAQNLGGVWSFSRRQLVHRRWAIVGGPPIVAGALLGAWIATVVDDAFFQDALGIAMLIIAAYTVWDPVKARVPSEDPTDEELDLANHPLGRFGISVALFLIGVYGGFIQIGLGFLILAIAASAGIDFVRGSAMKVLLVLLYTIPVLALFWFSGKVDLAMGLALALGNMTGAFIGVRLAVAAGHKWVKRIVTVAVVALAARMLLG